VEWVDSGAPPTSIAPIEVDPANVPAAVRDEFGNARGGVRLPDLEAPTATHLATRVDASNGLSALTGQTTPLPLSAIERRSPDAGAYVKAWNDAVERLAAVGLVLDEDLDPVRERGQAIAAEVFA
jgi:hypothetical protein